MTTASITLGFDQADLFHAIDPLSREELDELDFGVIGIDDQCVVRQYNHCESQFAGLSRDRVIGNLLFTVVAPCMNNYLVAQRFEDALAAGEALDVTLDYIFTLRMRPVKVKLRLLAVPGHANRYVIVQRKT